MTPQQLAEIEKRWAKMMISNNSYLRNISANLFLDVRDLMQEVRRLNRMVDSACNLLTMDSMFSAEGWRKYLQEGEVD